MGRKTANAKEKKLQRKEEAAQLKASLALIEKVENQEDLLSSFAAFKKFNKNGLNCTLECKKYPELEQSTFDWIFELEKANMRDMYEQCEWGWNEKKKREEMTEDKAWYLLARDEEGKPVAFSHFRFDMDYGDEVLYVYELQLEKEVRRKGLGKFMLQVLELVGFTAQMKKIILTVLKHNPDAVAFFKALNYQTDETSPEDNLYEEYHYVILSKLNKKITNNQK